jgi:hypothetical protein
MIKQELIKRSPLRVLEAALNGGLGKGNIGVLASPKGVGKTACLVHIATDKLFQRKPVIHVSYSSRVDYIINWYEDIFREMAKELNLDSDLEIHDEIIKNRVIMNFRQEGMRTEQVLKSVRALIDNARFPADAVIIDGYDFSRSSGEDMEKFKDFARQAGLELWFSASLKGDEPLYGEDGIPCLLSDSVSRIDVLITLHFKENSIRLHVVKDRGRPAPGELPLKLDPKTLLLA